jgi:hypothetical protein
MVNQEVLPTNKTQENFVMEQKEDEFDHYVDVFGKNHLQIGRKVKLYKDQATYQIIINGNEFYKSEKEIRKIFNSGYFLHHKN